MYRISAVYIITSSQLSLHVPVVPPMMVSYYHIVNEKKTRQIRDGVKEGDELIWR